MLKVKVNTKNEYAVTFTGSDFMNGAIDGKDFALDIIETKPGVFHVIKDNKSYNVELIKADFSEKTFAISVNGNKYQLAVKDKYDELLHKLGLDVLSNGKVNEIKAPMPGLVLEVRVAEGAVVKKGDIVLVLEAMKMENILKSPSDGVVKTTNVQKGMAVEKNQVLISFV